MLLSKTVVSLAVIPLAIALECTVPDSTPWPFSSSSPDGTSPGGGSVTDVCAQFEDDPAAYEACASTALEGECNAVGCPDSSDGSSSGDDLISNSGDDLISSGDSDDSGLIRRLRARDTLTCTDDETCYQFTDDSLLCYNGATGDYHDDVGGTGNYFDGTYSAPSGSATTGSAASGSPSATTGGPSQTANSASNSSASPTSGAGAVRPGIFAGGILGLALGLVL